MKKYVIDTNVIIRYLLGNDKELFKKARYFFDLLKMGKAKAYLEQTVFTEVIFVLSKVYNVPKEEISRTLSNLLMLKGILNEERDILLESLQIYKNTNLHIVDCIIAAKCRTHNIKPITFDEELKKVTTKQNLKEET
ncbi:MAG: PIN domain-containing protein [Rickettsiales bacterium]|nr:PIN domain-containing protein [Rickettsiales bacterium]